MSRIVRSKTSFNDTVDIWRYIGRDNPAAATALIERVDEKLSFLADASLAGTPRPDLGQGLRSVVVGNYLLYYRPLRDGIRLVRVLHASRDARQVFRR